MAIKNAILAAALSYAKRGWRVFPLLALDAMQGCECGEAECDRPGKHPAVKGWNKVATTDLKQILAWWTEHPNWGVGIATGEESGISVLDVDGAEGTATIGALAGAEGMPTTPTVQSRNGRFHYYFRYNPDIKSRSKSIGAGLDTRSEGGYVVAPPSPHASGSLYTWLVTPEKAALADWPAFLKEGAKAGGDKKKRGRPAKETFNPANPQDRARLEAALQYVDADDEEKWGQTGWIMGRAFHQSDVGFALYSAWAGRSRKYDARRTKAHYYERSKEIRGGELKTTSSIYAWAREGGWVEVNPEATEEREFHIFQNPFRESTMVAEFAAALTHAPRVFVMDKRLIRIVHYGQVEEEIHAQGVTRDPDAWVVLDHEPDTLAVELGNIAAFWSQRAQGMQRSGFPRADIKTFMSYREYGKIKPLIAFVAHPTLRNDGSLIDKVGYDVASRLFLTAALPGLDVNPRLTPKQARAQLQTLIQPFDEFPWSRPVDRTVFLAALFTVGFRHLFDVVPLFAFASPKQGSGKTLLAESISRLWYGITLSKATWTPNPEEMEKRIAAFLLAGDRIVCLDNVAEGTRLDDTTLNKVLTSRRNTFRILGRTERVELTNEATWFATGNQLSISGDMVRRALMCYIDAKVPDPSARRFKISGLAEWVQEHRLPLMNAALSIVASWMAAGRPVPAPATRDYGSFGAWYAMMRPLLMWCGEPDLTESIEAVREEDAEEAALEAFANVLRRALPPDGERLPIMGIMKLFSTVNELRPAFAGVMPQNVEPNHRTLSDLMRRCENKVFISDNPGHYFVINRRISSTNIHMWGVEYRDQQ